MMNARAVAEIDKSPREALRLARRQATYDRAEKARQDRQVELERLLVIARRPPDPKAWNGLHPEACASEMSKDIKGGLPGGSLGSGSRSAEKPTPRLDQTDVGTARDFAVYAFLVTEAQRHALAGNVEKARTFVARAISLESGVLPRLHMTPEHWAEYLKRMELKARNVVGKQSCANSLCPEWMFPKQMLKPKGSKPEELRCPACYEYKGDHDGKERPMALCQRTYERRLGRSA